MIANESTTSHGFSTPAIFEMETVEDSGFSACMLHSACLLQLCTASLGVRHWDRMRSI